MTRFRTIFMLILLCVVALPALSAGQDTMMNVQVKQTQVRSAPSFLGKIVIRLSYGDSVRVIRKKGAWVRVGAGTGIEGWMHNSALTEKEIMLRAGAGNVSQAVTGNEVALAGKGFNKQVEQEFRTKNPHLDFSWIDRMEMITIPQDGLQSFMETGELSAGGGAR
ncbi:SH3 domain-containing protein [Desulfococcaceae bacterium HSG8]|nr:SH3 domain-containing protein [Desulfococcaceae bacterium HSG8]